MFFRGLTKHTKNELVTAWQQQVLWTPSGQDFPKQVPYPSSCGYFCQHRNAAQLVKFHVRIVTALTTLVADAAKPGKPKSIANVGFFVAIAPRGGALRSVVFHP